MMKKFLGYSLLLMLLACSGTPKIQFTATSFDFGDQKQGEKLKHVFEFTNAGTSTLVIEKVKAG